MKILFAIFLAVISALTSIKILDNYILEDDDNSENDSQKAKKDVNKTSKKVTKSRTSKKEKKNKLVKKGFNSKSKKKDVNLTARQSKIMEIVKDKKVDMKEISTKIKGVHVRTLRRDMKKLEDMGLILKTGSTKDTHYERL